MRRRLSPGLLCLVMLLASARPGLAQSSGLRFFKNYVYTGSHFAAGVTLKGTGVNGVATKTITINEDPDGVNGVPRDAEILAAYLYWMTVTTPDGNGATSATFNLKPNPDLVQPDGLLFGDIRRIAKNLNPNGTPPCWSNGGATGDGSGVAKVMKAYRADVMPFLPSGTNHRRTVIGTHTITLQDSGTGNSLPSTAGATLLVIYKKPGADLTSTVIYDGGVTLNQSNPSFTQTLEGWYQTKSQGSTASLTQIVANGSIKSETVTVNANGDGMVPVNDYDPIVGPSWDTYTKSIPAFSNNSSSATVTIQRPGTTGSFDCLSWGAMVMSVPVQDNDGDGIIDRLESAQGAGTIADPLGRLLPNLYAMGARPDTKDIFVEMGFMSSGTHTHLPEKDALRMVAKAFRDMSLPNTPAGVNPWVNLHFDIGDVSSDLTKYQQYQNLPLPGTGNDKWANCWTSVQSQWDLGCAIIPPSLADGGEFINEVACYVPAGGTAGAPCQFPQYPGTVGWKSGFNAYRDEPVDYSVYNTAWNLVSSTPFPNERTCFVAENDNNPRTVCTRRFAPERFGLFHYSLWAHATGIPSDANPARPKNISGMGDVFGGDFMVTLGLWDRQVGSTFMQASTLMHELGHNLGLEHGGRRLSSSEVPESNCKPNYISVMNYMFQVGGIPTAAGVPVIGYSTAKLGNLTEWGLSEAAGVGKGGVITRWWLPADISPIHKDKGLGKLNLSTPTVRRCNGAGISGVAMAKVDGTATTAGAIDWNLNGLTTNTPILDVNFSTQAVDTLAGSNDVAGLDLQQIGSRRNVGGWSVGSGYWDAGYWDAGATPDSASGYWDAGYWDAGYWDAGYWDAGYWDAGYWDAGYWDAGAQKDEPDGELDLETALDAEVGPTALGAAVVNKQVIVSWQPPIVGSDRVDHYEVYRIEGTAVTQAAVNAKVTISASIPPSTPTVQVQDSKAKPNVTYTYIAVAHMTDGRRNATLSPPFILK